MVNNKIDFSALCLAVTVGVPIYFLAYLIINFLLLFV